MPQQTWSNKVKQKLPDSKTKMFAAVIVAAVTITTTFGLLFYREVNKHKRATKPLGYKEIDRKNIPKIKDRNKDIVKDRFIPSKVKENKIKINA